MVIEILAEDKSGSVVVKRAVERICDREKMSCEINVRPHRGCGSFPPDMNAKPPKFASALLDLLPAKCRAYNEIYRDQDMILIVVMDSDDHDPTHLRNSIYNCASRYAPDLRNIVGLCTEEVEAWMLGDRRAVLDAYPDADMSVLDSYDQDSVCGTWEVLCRAVSDNADDIIEIGYPAIGHYKARWAEEISRYMIPADNISPSYITFKYALETALRNPRPIYRKRTF
ncbi:MAG: hypothetical protein LKF32_01845 [Mageeibacillus sp.]|jgi:hypothetical protein|nr:hypothetical protein [Mageeibacillus sp.]MCI1263614.1 hypothetical protein [Saccharofermentans sp.]MCI1769375.1 hypothetical protein [Mageeibacillus sp.]